MLYTCSEDDTLDRIGSVQLGHEIHQIEANLDGMLAVRTSGSISFLSTSDDQLKLSRALDFPISSLKAVFNPSPSFAEECAVLLADGSIYLWDAIPNTIEKVVQLSGESNSCFYAAHPRQLFITKSKSLSLFDLRVRFFSN